MRPPREQRRRIWSTQTCSRQLRRELEQDENARASDALLAAMRHLEAFGATEYEELAETARAACETLWWRLFVVRHDLEPPEDLAGSTP